MVVVQYGHDSKMRNAMITKDDEISKDVNVSITTSPGCGIHLGAA
jgi:hypothetical protein